MRNVIAVQAIILYMPHAVEVSEEAEDLIDIQVLAPDAEIDLWASEELDDIQQHMVEVLEERTEIDGVYSVICLYSLTGGRDPDTPDGPGEYWTAAHPLSEPYVAKVADRMFREEWNIPPKVAEYLRDLREPVSSVPFTLF